MADYPYTTVPGKIAKLFEKIKETGIPQKATRKWLKSIGFTSSNDGSLLPILAFIGMTDASGVPTDRWQLFRGDQGKQILAECIRKGYEGVFSVYPDAHTRNRSELESFFSTHSSAGKQAIGKKVSTFLELCKLADFSATKVRVESAAMEDEPDIAESVTVARKSYKGFAININIQLTLPETTDGKVYDAFFSAMKKHLLEGDA